jgi:hypothetical protein
MHNYNKIERLINEAIEAGNNSFAICPMGLNGILTKQILNWRYGINEKYIIDNKLSKLNKNILSVPQLSEKDCSNIIVILNAEDYNINLLLYKELLKYLPSSQIINIRFLTEDAPEKYNYFLKVRQLLKIQDIDCNNLGCGGGGEYMRIGKPNDGGYIMLDNLSKTQIAYSFGINNDVSWDMDMAKRGIEVYMYDHTIEYLPEENDKFHFSRIGISDKDNAVEQLLSMETILALNKHQNCNNLLLKMDVEGAEWDFLNSTSSEILAQFAQMTFEFHFMTNKKMESIIIPALEKLNKTHQAIWIHGNNGGIVQKAKDILIPDILEVTFVRRSDYAFKKSERIFPTELDMPNAADFKDIYLGNWG